MARTNDATVERFRATTGRMTGWMTIVVAVAVVIAGLLYVDEGFPVWVIPAAVLVAALAWATMVRPALWVHGDHLVMRNMSETVHIRMASIEEMAVRQVLAVRAGERRWVSTTIGRTRRKAMKSGRSKSTNEEGERPDTAVKYVDFVEERLHHLVDEARAAAGVRAGSAEQSALPDAVRRERAWVPTAVIVVALVGLVVTVLL